MHTCIYNVHVDVYMYTYTYTYMYICTQNNVSGGIYRPVFHWSDSIHHMKLAHEARRHIGIHFILCSYKAFLEVNHVIEWPPVGLITTPLTD